MKNTRRRERGFMLILVVTTMALVGGVLTVLADFAASQHKAHKVCLLDNAADSIASSVSSMIRANARVWQEDPPPQATEIDISQLLPSRTTGSATITWRKSESGTEYHVEVILTKARYPVRRSFSLDIGR